VSSRMLVVGIIGMGALDRAGARRQVYFGVQHSRPRTSSLLETAAFLEIRTYTRSDSEVLSTVQLQGSMSCCAKEALWKCLYAWRSPARRSLLWFLFFVGSKLLTRSTLLSMCSVGGASAFSSSRAKTNKRSQKAGLWGLPGLQRPPRRYVERAGQGKVT
jgi:hypothetical protein